MKMRTQVTPPPAFDPSLGAPPTAAPAPAAAPLSTGNANGDPGAAPAEAETQPLSPQFAALARQRRALQVKEREIADREKALAAQPAQAGTVPLEKLKSDPLGVLFGAGVTWDDLTKAITAHNPNLTPEKVQELVQQQVKAAQDQFKSELDQRDTVAKQQALREIKREAQALIAQGDDFEMIREMNKLDDVMGYIEAWYQKTGEILDTREALQDMEDLCLEDTLKTAGLKKVQAKLQPPAPTPQQRAPMRTLSNRDTAQVPVDRKQRALAAFWNQLPKTS
jgi:hypothetical protein